MGYKLPEQTAVLRLHGSLYEGAEVRVNLGVSVGVVLHTQELMAKGLLATEGKDAPAEQLDSLIDLFAGAGLRTWNLERDNGEPIPADVDGIHEIPVALFTLLIQHWMEAITATGEEQNAKPSPLADTINQPMGSLSVHG
jgi:hypothetical protein